VVGRVGVGLGARLAEIREGLRPGLAPERVVRETLDVLGDSIRVHALHHLDDPGVERPPSLLEETRVRDLVGERVLERVLQDGVEKLSRLFGVPVGQ